MKYLIIIFLLTLTSVQAQELRKAWEVSDLEAPESVIYDANNNFYYISNIAGQPTEKNRQGYISLLTVDGKMKAQKWIAGLNAPKGLGIFKNQLYIADIDQVVIADLKTGKIIKRLDAKGATFLNDVEVDANGTVYITDTFGGNAIYKVAQDNTISLWLKDDQLDYPNGLKLWNHTLYVASWGVVTNPETFGTDVPGKLLAVDPKTKEIKEVTGSIGNLDGMVVVNGKLWISDWIAGGIMEVDTSGNHRMIKDLKPGSADIFYNKEDNTVLVPQMLDGTLAAYVIK